jgi:branched-chain amino acid transport system permease protein
MSTAQETAPQIAAADPAAAKSALNIQLIASLVSLALLVVVPMFMKNFFVFQLTIILTYAIAILSLNILTGASGQFSLGHSAFFAAGAYACGIMMEHASIPYPIAIPLAGVICFVIGFLFGFPALRLKGVYLALATFALAVAAPPLFKLGTFEHWTGGVQGLLVTKPDAPFGLPISQDRWVYYMTLFIGLVIYVLSVNLLGSRSGRAMMAIRDNEIAASSMGVDLALYKTLTFGVSAGFTGIAGALSAIAIAYVAPDAYTVNFAISLFLGMVIGGVGWLPGSLFGAAFILLVPNISEGISKGLSGAVFGVFIIAVIFLLPNGARQLVGLVHRLWNEEENVSRRWTGREFGPEIGVWTQRGISLAAVVLAVLANYAPAYGFPLSAAAVVFASIGALAGSRTLAVAAALILTFNAQWLTGVPYRSIMQVLTGEMGFRVILLWLFWAIPYAAIAAYSLEYLRLGRSPAYR